VKRVANNENVDVEALELFMANYIEECKERGPTPEQTRAMELYRRSSVLPFTEFLKSELKIRPKASAAGTMVAARGLVAGQKFIQ
jgi:hypothetical protein